MGAVGAHATIKDPAWPIIGKDATTIAATAAILIPANLYYQSAAAINQFTDDDLMLFAVYAPQSMPVIYHKSPAAYSRMVSAVNRNVGGYKYVARGGLPLSRQPQWDSLNQVFAIFLSVSRAPTAQAKEEQALVETMVYAMTLVSDAGFWEVWGALTGALVIEQIVGPWASDYLQSHFPEYYDALGYVLYRDLNYLQVVYNIAVYGSWPQDLDWFETGMNELGSVFGLGSMGGGDYGVLAPADVTVGGCIPTISGWCP